MPDLTVPRTPPKKVQKPVDPKTGKGGTTVTK